MKNNILSINAIYLEEYEEYMLDLVDRFYEYSDPAPLSQIIEAFEFEMFIDDNLADKVRLSADDLVSLREIQIKVLDKIQKLYAEYYIPEDVLIEFKPEFDMDSDKYYEIVLDLENDFEDDDHE